MACTSSVEPEIIFELPISAETRHVNTLLSTVDVRSLLQILASLSQQNDDASLIIAVLLDRLSPAGDGSLD